ncbi:beta/gamma crystallin domain-containing protein [Paenibacillus sp. 481]|uniref:beta/gamma crystallin domain-containing protein n=1 Tax=Paenibacillus sp. 481 TaxID=2835869 RepID=UPI001E631459|nr:beta/gamma crystallin domain-containing protein [Paenibacillus sp. 481]UHA73473.1 peptidase inhibitor family I36 protein [Paenibacillus sp. 481]
MAYHPYIDHTQQYNPEHYDQSDARQQVNRFFEHINGTGMSFALNSGNDLSYVGNPWNDRISSVRVAPKTLVVLYEHANFSGLKKILENKTHNSHLFNIHSDFNDKVSSIKTYRLC